MLNLTISEEFEVEVTEEVTFTNCPFKYLEVSTISIKDMF